MYTLYFRPKHSTRNKGTLRSVVAAYSDCGILARIKEERRNKKMRRNERKINKRRSNKITVPE